MTDVFVKIGANKYSAEDYNFPTERTFRDAWFADAGRGVIDIDMVAARQIWRNKIREARIPELAKLDTEFMKALETGADTTSIVAQKQALRDAPSDPAIDAATTPDELKLVKPAGLKVE